MLFRSKVRDVLGPQLISYIQNQAPHLLDEIYLDIYTYMSKDLDFNNSSRILFTSEYAAFIPSNTGGKLFKAAEEIRTTKLSSIQSCDIGDAHNSLSYGFTGQSDSYFFDLYWTLASGRVITTRSYAGGTIGMAKSYFNREIKPLAEKLGEYIEFSTDGGHVETESGSRMGISYGVWF